MKKAIPYLLVYIVYVAVYLAELAVIYPQLPWMVPSHWSGGPTPDGYQSKLFMSVVGLGGIFILPAILYPALLIITRLTHEPFPGREFHLGSLIGTGLLLLGQMAYFGYLIHPDWLQKEMICILVSFFAAIFIALRKWAVKGF